MMEKNPFAKGYRDLIVYQKAREVAKLVFAVTSSFPKDEMYSLIDQARRSSRSVGAQIAEAWAKRRYPKHFTSKLSDADGEQNETQHWLDTSVDCGYLKAPHAAELNGKLQEIGRMLQCMMDRAGEFQGPNDSCVHETAQPYGSSTLDKFFSPLV